MPKGRRHLGWMAAAVVLFMAVVALAIPAVVHLNEVPAEMPVIQSTVLPPEGTTFDFSSGLGLPALSPDGTRTSLGHARPTARHRSAQFSPDGRWVAFQSNESGRFEIYVVPFPLGSGKWPISTDGGIAPRWRHDGKELFFIGPDGEMMAAAISVSGASVEAAPPVELFQTRIVDGGGNSANKHQYAVSTDGRFLINVPAGDAAGAPLTLVQNWKPRVSRR